MYVTRPSLCPSLLHHPSPYLSHVTYKNTNMLIHLYSIAWKLPCGSLIIYTNKIVKKIYYLGEGVAIMLHQHRHSNGFASLWFLDSHSCVATSRWMINDEVNFILLFATSLPSHDSPHEIILSTLKSTTSNIIHVVWRVWYMKLYKIVVTC